MQFHGVISERVVAVTSVTTGRARRFETPVGLFTYRAVPLEAFSKGMEQMDTGDNRNFLMATPEKALADKLYDDRGTGISTQKELEDYLEKRLRIDPSARRELDEVDKTAWNSLSSKRNWDGIVLWQRVQP